MLYKDLNFEFFINSYFLYQYSGIYQLLQAYQLLMGSISIFDIKIHIYDYQHDEPCGCFGCCLQVDLILYCVILLPNTYCK